MAGRVAPALRALLGNLVDYAGMFPPASLPVEAALSNYQRYRTGPHAWMAGRFVISAADLDTLRADMDLPFAVLSDSDHPRAAAIESKRIISASKPVYCEASLDQIEEVKRVGSFAKIRTGGVTPQTIPSVEYVAEYISACAELRMPFKATAGLHHPIRSEHPLTYKPGGPSAMIHGFINVFVAAAFAWHGERRIDAILAETDPAAFKFDDRAHWRDRSLEAGEIRAARTEFAHSFGSCSFQEPIQDLQGHGWL
ncbi:MAG: hypothetical protein WB992_02960 [Bryobacteraceae bacterium]